MPTIHAAPIWTVLTSSVSAIDLVHDFSRYDAYLDDLGVLFLTDGQTRKVSRTIQLRAPKTDIGETRFEARPEYGDHYTQGDFAHGANQRFFHRPTRDEAKFLSSEGFDISEPGVLTHLPAVDYVDAALAGWTDPTALVHYNGKIFFAGATKVVGSNVWNPGTSVTWTEEDPQAAEGAQDVEDLTSSGDFLFAAIGTNGVHVRTAAGVWSHVETSGAVDLDIGTATVVQWVKDRLIAVGNAGLDIYEVIIDANGDCSTATPTSIETLAPGWTFVQMFEYGAFIMAVAINTDLGLSRIHAYGLNSGGTALEKKASTLLPKGDVARCGHSTVGRAFIAGGRQNDGNYDPFLYECVANDTGELSLSLIAVEEDVAADGSVYDITSTRDAIIFGWTDGSRQGLGIFNLARNAFAYHLSSASAFTTEAITGVHPVTSVVDFDGRLVWATGSAGLVLWDDSPNTVVTAQLVASIADWNSFGFKTWDLFEIRHSAMPLNTSVELEYSTKPPEDDEWFTAITSAITGATGAEARVEDIRSRSLVARLTSTSNDPATTPEIFGYSVRSVASPANPEWELVRTIRVVDRDRKDKGAEPVLQDPRSVKDEIESLAYGWITLYEPGATWTAHVESIAEVEPVSPAVSETFGTSEREAYYLELRMIGRKAV